MTLSTFIMCDCQHDLVPDFITTSGCPVPMKQSLPVSSCPRPLPNRPLSPWQPPVCILTLQICLFGASYINGIIKHVAFCVQPLLCLAEVSGVTRVPAGVYFSGFHTLILFTPLLGMWIGCISIVRLSVGSYLGCFCLRLLSVELLWTHIYKCLLGCLFQFLWTYTWEWNCWVMR